jgi:hypothetical protein
MVVGGEQGDEGEQQGRQQGNPALTVDSTYYRRSASSPAFWYVSTMVRQRVFI